MTFSLPARLCFAFTAAIAILAVSTQVVLAFRDEAGLFDSSFGRAVNAFAYFTTLSNLLTAFVVGALGRPEPPIDPHSRRYAVLRLTSLISIIVTGAVYHLVLAGEADNTTIGEVATQGVHTVVPLLTVIGWLVIGPRGLDGPGVALRALIFPVAWLIFTLLRGAIDGYYPYPFVDVSDLGYGPALLNCLVVAVGFIAMAVGALVLDRRLPGRRSERAPAAAA